MNERLDCSRVELGMLAGRRGIDDDDQTSIWKEPLQRRPQDVAIDVFGERLDPQVVDRASVVEMHVLPGGDVPLKCHVLEHTGECRGGVDRIGDGVEGQRGMESGKTLVRERKAGVIVVDRRIEQNFRM